MKETQDWGAVWSGPKTFHPSTVPLPLRQGFLTTKSGTVPPPDRYANAELMKIPNFLHLTPPVVQKQCQAIKKFCTPWPKNLETDEKCEQNFPIEFISSDYCHGLPTIRNPLARIIALKVREIFCFAYINVSCGRANWMNEFFIFLVQTEFTEIRRAR